MTFVISGMALVAALWLRPRFGVVAAAMALIWGVVPLLIWLAPEWGPSRLIREDYPRTYLWIALAVGILAYRAALAWLRHRAIAPEEPSRFRQDDLSGPELDRYARHIVLREIGGMGQKRLKQANVLIVGAGGLGAPVCLYLAAAGVGRITIADDDVVSLSNLQRQVIFRHQDEGQLKAIAATQAMQALNIYAKITPLTRRIRADDHALVAEYDLVIDGTDNFEGRAAINQACVTAGTPLLAGAIAQWEGQITLYDPARDAPCFACMFPTAPAAGLAPSCAEAGVIGPLPGVIGSILALEAVKDITRAGAGLRGQMIIFDGLYGESRRLKIQRRADCPVCAATKG